MISNDIFEEKYLIRNGAVENLRLFGSVPDEGVIVFRLTAHRSAGVARAVLCLHSDGLSKDGGRYIEAPLEPESFGIWEVFSVRVNIPELLSLGGEGLFYYGYRVSAFEGEMYLGGEEVRRLAPVETAGERQLLVYSRDFETPDFLKGGCVYQIFVDRFYSSGRCAVKEGAVLNPDWDEGCPMYPEYRGAPLKNNEFFGGDLWGIIEKLDYLEALGVTTLYLSPIFESPSNHKYDASDYLSVDSMFGGDEALSALCGECGKRGMNIILDGVFNHTGDDSIYFDRYSKYKSGAAFSKASPYYDWYSFSEYPEKYECWWGIDIMPRVNSANSSYMSFIFGEGGVVDKWMGVGVAGFRLDVADELSDAFLDGFRSSVKAHRADGAVIGEVWEDASDKIAYGKRRHYFSGGQLDSVMNYPLREGVISFIRDGDGEGLRRVCEGLYRRYPKCVSDVLMNFLGTHDTERILTVLAGEDSAGCTTAELAVKRLTAEERKRGRAMLECAFTIIAFMYGFPSVFYGDEAGAEGYHDPFCRRPFPWRNTDGELVRFFSSAIGLRREHSVFRDGFFEVIGADRNSFIFKRYNDKEKIIVCVTRDSEAELDFAYGVRGIFSTPGLEFPDGVLRSFTVPARSAAVFLKVN